MTRPRVRIGTLMLWITLVALVIRLPVAADPPEPE